MGRIDFMDIAQWASVLLVALAPVIAEQDYHSVRGRVLAVGAVLAVVAAALKHPPKMTNDPSA